MVQHVSRQLVLDCIDALPAFPKTVQEVLKTVDDPDSSMSVLAHVVGRDPAIAARVLAQANKAATNSRRAQGAEDIYTATSLVGMQQVREIAVLSCMADFLAAISGGMEIDSLWRHSVGVAVCAQELALWVRPDVSIDHALIAGLLHDIGQFWLLIHDPEAYVRCLTEGHSTYADMLAMERQLFGADHAEIGGWLATAWQLPPDIVASVAAHHDPDAHPARGALVPLLHIAEVLSCALELGGGPMSRVTTMSPAACRTLGLVWNDDIRPLFGRIEARSRHVIELLGAETVG